MKSVIERAADLRACRAGARLMPAVLLGAMMALGAACPALGAAPAAKLSVSTAQYEVPDVRLTRDSGKAVSLRQELDDGRPVLLNFIFTTCGSICPLASQTFSVFQDKLGAEAARVHLVSISIDPEQDTPARLREYARRYSAGPSWQHYTGTVEASLATQRAFGAYRGDKMGHTPLTLLRIGPGKPWHRIDGFATPDDLLREYRAALKAD